MSTVDLVWFNAGGGHRAAALALEQAIHQQGRPWTVRRVNLTEVLDPTALFRRTLGFEPEDLYNKRLATGFTLGLAQELRLLQAGIRLAHGPMLQRLAAHWRSTRPDLVVSLVPNFNRVLHDSLAAARPGVPFVTVMTDMADHPPAFWAEPGTAQHLVCGTAHAAAQALAAGLPPRRVHRVSGMLLRPEFHAPPATDRRLERAMVGLDADTPVGLVMFGGTGSRVMLRIARALPETPLTLICGRNEALAAALRAQPARAPRIVVGFTAEVQRWMRRADFFIGKPGPGSLSEAVSQGLPVITTRNAWTMPQERWNTEWVREHGLGLVIRRFVGVADTDGVHGAVAALRRELPAFRARVAAMNNRALFEVPERLAAVLAETKTEAAVAGLASSH